MAGLRADALARMPDLTVLSRSALRELRMQYMQEARAAVDQVERAWWMERVYAVDAERKEHPHGKPRTRAAARHQLFRAQGRTPPVRLIK